MLATRTVGRMPHKPPAKAAGLDSAPAGLAKFGRGSLAAAHGAQQGQWLSLQPRTSFLTMHPPTIAGRRGPGGRARTTLLRLLICRLEQPSRADSGEPA